MTTQTVAGTPVNRPLMTDPIGHNPDAIHVPIAAAANQSKARATGGVILGGSTIGGQSEAAGVCGSVMAEL
jgi:hypothetical protein